MYTVEVDPTLCRIMEVYRRAGIWQKEEESDFRSKCIRILYFLYFFLFFLYIVLGAVDRYRNDDMNQVIFLSDIAITVGILLVKLFYLLWRKDDILRFLYDHNVTHCTKDYSESVMANQEIRKLTIFYKAYALLLGFATIVVSFVALPIFTGDTKMLPAFILFTLETDYEMVVYWMAYLFAFVGCYCCAFYTGIMLFIWYIMYNYSIEYKLLGQRFRSLGPKTPNTYQQDLIRLIRAHNNLYDTIEQFRSCFSTLFLLQIVTGAVSICGSIFNLAYNTSINLFQISYYVIFLLYEFFEIFLDMYASNEITLESDRIFYSLFESNWTDQSEYIKKNVIIFGEMIKRPHELAIFIYPMNLETFTSIVNGAYSMFNVMKSFK